ncbi:MAG: hydrogenase nickel incorporation protein HypB, partial [Methylococcaceae bacterium]
MCGICGCSQTDNTSKFKPVSEKIHPVLQHDHSHHHADLDTGRLVKIEQDLLSKNNAYAAQNRRFFQQHAIFTLNLVSSPGAGKTTLLVETIKRLKDRFPIAVIEG